MFNRKEIAIIITLFLFYAYYQNTPVFANRYLFLTYDIVNNHTLKMDDAPGKSGDLSYKDGHYYLGVNPGLSFMAVPVYAAIKTIHGIFFHAKNTSDSVNHFFINLLISNTLNCLTAVMLFRVLAMFGLNSRKRIFIVMMYGLGTILFTYSLEYSATAVGVFFGFSAFYFIQPLKGMNFDYYSVPFSRVFISGFCLGMCLLVGYEYTFFTMIFALYILSRFDIRRILLYTLGGAVCVGILLIYQKICFGGWFTSSALYLVGNVYKNLKTNTLGFSRFSPHAFVELLIGNKRGYFLFMPAMLLSVMGAIIYFKGFVKKDPSVSVDPRLANGGIREIILSTSILPVYISLFSCFYFWEAGSSFGPRYFTISIPFFIILASFAARSLPYSITMALGSISIIFNWFGAQFKYNITTNAFSHIRLFFENGPSSTFTRWIIANAGLPESLVRSRSVAVMNITFLAIAAVFLWFIWTRYASINNECDEDEANCL